MNDRLIDLIMRMLGSQGRGGDTMRAHVNPREAQMLKDAGGSGTTNPKTGLPEFSGGGGNGGSPNGGGSLSIDPRGESTAGQGGSVGAATSPGPAQDAAGGPSGSGFGLGNALTLAQAAIAPALGPFSMASGMAQNIYSGTPAKDLTQEQVMSMVPMGSLAMALGKGVVGLGNMLGLENQGNAAPSTAPGANDTSSGLDAFLSAYLQPQAPVPATPQQPTPEQQALAARGFYSTPTPSTSAPVGAIDPALLSAMLSARG